MRIETLACHLPPIWQAGIAGEDGLREPPVDLAGVKEIVELSKTEGLCQGTDGSCNPIVHMGGY